jgi:hypothetical protein
VPEPDSSPISAEDQSAVDAHFKATSSYWNDIYRRDDVMSLMVQQRFAIAFFVGRAARSTTRIDRSRGWMWHGTNGGRTRARGFRVYATDASGDNDDESCSTSRSTRTTRRGILTAPHSVSTTSMDFGRRP